MNGFILIGAFANGWTHSTARLVGHRVGLGQSPNSWNGAIKPFKDTAATQKCVD